MDITRRRQQGGRSLPRPSRGTAVLAGAGLILVAALLVATFSAPTAGAAVTVDSTSVETGTTSLTSLSFSHNTPSGSDRLLLVSAHWDDANDGDVTSVTYAGEELTCLGASERKDKVGTQFCYLVSPPTGSNTLDVSWGISVGEWGVVARSLSGVNQGTPIGATATVNGSSTDASTSVTSTDADSTLATAVTAADGTLDLSPVSGMHEDVEDAAGLVSTGISIGAGRTNTTTTSSYTTGWTLSASQPWALPVVEILRTPEQASFDQSSSSGDESTTSPTVGLSLDKASSEDITVEYSWTAGNTSNSDHNVTSGTITFSAGSTSETLTLDVTDDVADEPDETIEVTLENPSGAQLATPKTHTYTITDNDPNHAPDASDLSVSTDEDTDVSDTVSATDQDQNDTIDSFAVDTQPTDGSLTFDTSTGDFTYSPDADYNGGDSFTFTATDEHGATSSAATVDITVNSVNDAPSASDDSASTDEDETVWISVLDNDSDVDGDTLSVASATTPSNGSTSLPGNGTVEYTPDADWNGEESFTYDVTDGSLTDTATVTITVNAVNDAPSASDDSASTPVDETVWVDVLDNDSDVDGDTLSVASAGSPSHGTTSLPGNGTVEYTPEKGYVGSDSFTYNVSDGTVTTEAAVDISVTSGATEILSSNVRVIGGSLDSDPSLRTYTTASSAFFQLENASGGIELSELGATNSTTIEINLTTSNFTPTILMGRTQVVGWSNTTNDNGTENVSLELQPISMAFIDDCANYTSFMGYCGPSSPDNWPTSSDEDQADVAFDAGLRVFLSDLSYLNSTMRSNLQGAYMTTDAQALGQMNISGPDSPGGVSLTMPVAGPHLLPNGTQNYGFFEARLPDGLMSFWGIDEPSRLTGTYEGENRSVTISDVSKGTEVRMDIHYSSGEVNITEDTTDPTAKAGDDRTVDEDVSLDFDGSNSTDNQGVTSYDWDFGDGNNATGATPTHTFASPGTYTVTLNVSDAAGNTDTDNLTVTVESTGSGGYCCWSSTDSSDEEDEETDSETDADAEGTDDTDSEAEPVPRSGWDGGGSGQVAVAEPVVQGSGTEDDDRLLSQGSSDDGVSQADETGSPTDGSDPGAGKSGTRGVSAVTVQVVIWAAFVALLSCSIFGVRKWA